MAQGELDFKAPHRRRRWRWGERQSGCRCGSGYQCTRRPAANRKSEENLVCNRLRSHPVVFTPVYPYPDSVASKERYQDSPLPLLACLRRVRVLDAVTWIWPLVENDATGQNLGVFHGVIGTVRSDIGVILGWKDLYPDYSFALPIGRHIVGRGAVRDFPVTRVSHSVAVFTTEIVERLKRRKRGFQNLTNMSVSGRTPRVGISHRGDAHLMSTQQVPLYYCPVGCPLRSKCVNEFLGLHGFVRPNPLL